MIKKIIAGEKAVIPVPGGFKATDLKEGGILFLHDADDFYGRLLTDSDLLKLGYKKITGEVDEEEKKEFERWTGEKS